MPLTKKLTPKLFFSRWIIQARSAGNTSRTLRLQRKNRKLIPSPFRTESRADRREDTAQRLLPLPIA